VKTLFKEVTGLDYLYFKQTDPKL